MIKIIHKLTGSPMWVTDERKEEYIAAGHKLAAVSSESDKPKEEPKKRTAKAKKK